MKIAKFQEGGAVVAPVEQAVPVEEAPQQDPLMVIAQMFAEGLQQQNCELLAQGAQMFLELLSQAAGPEPVAAADAPAGEPVFKKGGVLKKRRRACK